MSRGILHARVEWVAIPAMLLVVFLADRLIGPIFYLFAALGAIIAYFGGGGTNKAPTPRLVAKMGMFAACVGAVALITAMLRAGGLFSDIRLLDRSIPFQLSNLCAFLGLLALLWRRIYAPGSRVPSAAVVALCLASWVVVGDASVDKELSIRAKVECMTGLREYCSTIQTYVHTRGHFPPAKPWLDSLGTTSVSRCPESPPNAGSYAYNSLLGGLPYGSIQEPEKVVMLFESDKKNAAGGPDLLPNTPRHLGGDNYAFADGQVKWIRRKQRDDGTWTKEPIWDWVIWKPVLKKDAKVKVP